MKKIFAFVMILTLVSLSFSFNVFAVDETSAGTFKVVKSASQDKNGMLFNVGRGNTKVGLESWKHSQYVEDADGNSIPNTSVFYTFLKSAGDSYFGDIIQVDVMTATSNMPYRFPLNIKYGDTFGDSVLSNISGKYLYVSYYIKTVPDINNEKNSAYMDPYLVIRDGSTNKDVSGKLGISKNISYSENWQKIEGIYDVSKGTLGSYTLPAAINANRVQLSDGTYANGTPTIVMAFGDSIGTYSIQIADLNVVMFDSDVTYNSNKDVSALKSLSFNGKDFDLTGLYNFSVTVDTDTTVEDLKEMLSYVPYIDCNRVEVTYPASLPGTIEITTYALSADVTDESEEFKTTYEIYADYPSGYCSLDVSANGTATMKINKIDNTSYTSKLIIAGYNENEMLSCKAFDVNVAADAGQGIHTITENYTVNGAEKYKAFCFKSLLNAEPLIKAAERVVQ